MKATFTISILFLTVVFTGCVETIVMDPHDKNLPVAIHCVLSNPTNEATIFYNQTTIVEQKQSITIQYVKGKSEQDYLPVENAEVYICASKTLQGTDDTIRFVYVGDGKWESEATLRILDETKYTLYVNIPGRETIWAETVSQPYRALGLHLMEEYLEYDEEKARESILRQPYCFGESDDSPVWIFAQEYTPEGWIDLDYLVTDNPFADDMNITGKHFSELEITGNQDMDDESDYRLRYVFETSKRMMHDIPLHKGFIRIRKAEAHSPFFLHAGPIWFLNLEANDYYGMYDERLVDYDFDLETQERIPVFGKFQWPWNQYVRFCFHYVNSDLDEYLRNVYIHGYKSENYLTALYSTTNTVTNIHGGVGVFGCDTLRYVLLIDPFIYVK